MRYEKPPSIVGDAAQQSRRYGARRETVTLYCDVRQGSYGWNRVRLTELSQTGFRLEYAAKYNLSDPLRIRIAGLAPLTANIRWTASGQMGCEFERSLHIAVFDHIVKQSAL